MSKPARSARVRTPLEIRGHRTAPEERVSVFDPVSLVQEIQSQTAIPPVEVSSQAILRRLTLLLAATYFGVLPELGPDPWYLAPANTILIHGQLSGPGLILVSIERLDFETYLNTGQLVWKPWTTLRTRTNIRGNYSVAQSFPVFYAGIVGVYRLHASTYPFGLVSTSHVALIVHAGPLGIPAP